ncbi:helix-turn-helix domain-containing protein [Prochlorococcus marinus]|uniref:helix-turn-helix domain-containing protein n=1 Tax=Prochlorococcus marinus TaxID=1219 RepID=UPI000940EB32|nr:helix-turn-helix domain-containing protein [Prochlorococcus marinus]
MNPTCIAAWTLVLLLLPVLILLWATESRHTRIHRYRHMGWTWQQIADRYHCSANTARRWSEA